MGTRIKRAFPVILSDNVPATRDFYMKLLGWRMDFDSDWFVHLRSHESSDVELGIMQVDHELVPAAFRKAPTGVTVTIVVDDVDAVFGRARSEGVAIVEEPRDLFYGQRRMLVTDPSGTLVDVSSECPPSEEFLASMQTGS